MFATPIAYLIDEAGIIANDVAVGPDAILALLAGQNGQITGILPGAAVFSFPVHG